MKIKIPTDKKFSGIYEGEYFGNIFASQNISLEKNKGKITLGEKYSDIFDNADDAQLLIPVAFVRTAADGTDRWWAMGHIGALFKTTNTDPEAGWTQDAIASSPTAAKWDMIEFASALLVATDTDIDRLSTSWDTDWWSDQAVAVAMQAGKPHRFALFSGSVLITDGRFINTWDGTTAEDPGLTLPSQFDAQFIVPTADFVHIGTKSLSGAEAEVFTWDRTSATFNARYGIGDSECLAGFAVAGIPYMITKKGEIKRFTGQGYTTIQQFPTVELSQNITDINPNGVVVDENIVKILVNFGVLANMRKLSGIWTFDASTNNLYHSGSVVNDAGKDASQLELSAVGALVATQPTQGKYLVGATAYKTYTASTVTAIYSSDEDSTASQWGWFMTPKIPTADVHGYIRDIFIKFNNFKDSADRIYVFYRTTESTTLPAYETITFVTTTTCTGANDNVAVGDLILFLAGDNAGKVVRITAITDASPNTLTFPPAVSASTNAARAVYVPFRNLGTAQTQGVDYMLFNMDKSAGWHQFLFVLSGNEVSPEFEEVVINLFSEEI